MWIVSLGPGAADYLTPRAAEALRQAQVVVGYKTYLDLIEPLLHGKTVLASGMRKEIERCRKAVERALKGDGVALVSGGDAGIYGMAGLVFDVCQSLGVAVCDGLAQGDDAGEALPIEVIPGVAAFNAAASLLGAPLMHDFASISLSDHLTPWTVIEKRLMAAAEADFVIALYNPRSASRPDVLDRARSVLLRYRSGETPVGVVHRAMRAGQRHWVTTLKDLVGSNVDMQTVILVGNSQTYLWSGWMITPRGYLQKYTL
ncbi:precorrin-3B C(17)-methyltransferase [Desulfosoma caldarium]|uniref:precorrin-3B C(17)-methyltransferase n=1 Tax=Desulfosoma caldarium TaxID=610254 RepID=UPI001FECBFBA|nr:precorrin-3B C(17)-methyltransferase [Desulfosoma caldarium]